MASRARASAKEKERVRKMYRSVMQFARSMDIGWVAQRTEKAARGVLKKYRVPLGVRCRVWVNGEATDWLTSKKATKVKAQEQKRPGGKLVRIQSEWYPLPEDLPKKAKLEAKVAGEVAIRAHILRESLKDGRSAEDIGINAFLLGRLVESLRVAPYAPALSRGLDSLEWTKRGGEAAAGQSRMKWPKYEEAVKDTKRLHPQWSRSAICVEVATYFGVHVKTVWRRTKPPA